MIVLRHKLIDRYVIAILEEINIFRLLKLQCMYNHLHIATVAPNYQHHH
jgi:hypothetical protein